MSADELVQPVQAEPAPEPVQPAGDVPAPETVDTAPDPGSLQDEIKRLQETRDKARKDAEYWRREKAQSRADYFKNRQSGYQPPPAVPLPSEPQPPKQEDFDDYQKYQSAHSKYVSDLVEYRTTQKIKTWEQQQVQKQAEVGYQQRMTTLQEKINKGFEKYGDFEEVALSDTVPINQVVMDALAETENPEDISYYLGKNRAEAIQLSRMTPMAVSRYLGQLEMKLKQTPIQPSPGQNRIRSVSSAPPPIKPIGQQNTVTRDLEKMSQREFEAEMEKRTGRRF